MLESPLVWCPQNESTHGTVEGSLFRLKIIIFPSNFAMCRVHICQQPHGKLHSSINKDEIESPLQYLHFSIHTIPIVQYLKMLVFIAGQEQGIEKRILH